MPDEKKPTPAPPRRGSFLLKRSGGQDSPPGRGWGGSNILSIKGVWIALGLVSLGMLILPFRPEPYGEAGTFSLFLGRFHPMLVHFPIVLILLPMVFEGLIRWKKWDFLKQIQPAFILIAIVSAIFTAYIGYLLYGSGEYSGELIRNHLWGGVGVAVCMSLAGILYGMGREKIFLALLGISNLLLLYTGHLGGSLTHGENYLTEYLPEMGTAAPIEQKPMAELEVFGDIVMAAFEAKCLTCHNETKAKGRLVMSTFDDIMAGGKSKKTLLVAHQPDSSELFHRISLPEDHDDVMPPSGKAPLSEEEKTLIHWWIQSGADPEQQLGSDPLPDSVQLAINDYLPKIANLQRAQIKKKEERDALAKDLYPIVESLGMEITPDPEADSLLFALSMKFPPQKVTDADLVELLPYSHAFSRVSLVSSEITDDGLYTLSHFRELRSLVLAKTCIDGSGLVYLSQLPKLEALNLSETDVNNTTVMHLIAFPALKEVYVFNSEVSSNVIASLTAFMEGTEVLHQEGALF